jgi:hypothetical protein
LHQPFTGALLAGGWGLGVLAITHWRSRRLDVFAGLAATVAVIEVIGTVITRNPSVYLAASAIDSAVYGIILLGSLWWPRPLIQILAEAVSDEIGSVEFRRSRLYRSAWQILTTVWGVIHLLKASWLLCAQWWLPLEAFLVLRTASGLPLLMAMLAVSYWFPGWYWGRARAKVA